MSNIYSAISSVLSEIGAIGKEKKNQTQGFMYRGIDDVMNALQPVMAKYKIFVVPEVLEMTREQKETKSGGNLNYSILKIKYTFYTDDGSNIQAIVVGEAMDSADKATNKAMSVAFKYACFQVFCIPTEETKDPDADTHDLKPQIPPKQFTPQTIPTAQNKAELPPTSSQEQTSNIISEAQAKRLFAISKSKTENVRNVIQQHGYTSTKDIKKNDYDAICKEVEALNA